MRIESPLNDWMSDPFASLWAWLYDAAPYILIGVLIILTIVTPVLGFLSRKPLMWENEQSDQSEQDE